MVVSIQILILLEVIFFCSSFQYDYKMNSILQHEYKHFIKRCFIVHKYHFQHISSAQVLWFIFGNTKYKRSGLCIVLYLPYIINDWRMYVTFLPS